MVGRIATQRCGLQELDENGKLVLDSVIGPSGQSALVICEEQVAIGRRRPQLDSIVAWRW